MRHRHRAAALCGGGGPTDIRAMYEAVINYRTGAYEGDLSVVRKLPIRLKNPARLVYSVHEYPKEIGGYPGPESGPGYVDRMDRLWGWLIKENVAPVWIGEMGASMISPGSRSWGSTLLDYMDGGAPNGLRFSAGQQPIGGDWWAWGDLKGENPDGCIGNNGEFRPEQASYISRMLFHRPARPTSRPLAHVRRRAGRRSAG